MDFLNGTSPSEIRDERSAENRPPWRSYDSSELGPIFWKACLVNIPSNDIK